MIETEFTYDVKYQVISRADSEGCEQGLQDMRRYIWMVMFDAANERGRQFKSRWIF